MQHMFVADEPGDFAPGDGRIRVQGVVVGPPGAECEQILGPRAIRVGQMTCPRLSQSVAGCEPIDQFARS